MAACWSLGETGCDPSGRPGSCNAVGRILAGTGLKTRQRGCLRRRRVQGSQQSARNLDRERRHERRGEPPRLPPSSVDTALPGHIRAIGLPAATGGFAEETHSLCGHPAGQDCLRVWYVLDIIPGLLSANGPVYNLSVLSSISPRDTERLAPETENLLRLPSLFSVGVHDIPLLERLRNPKDGGHTPDLEPSEGWVACTTDEIIVTKTQLYDIIVELPPTYDAPPQERRWPRIRTSDGSLIKASQRDVARYKLLHKELFKQRNRSETSPEPYTDEENDDAAPLLSRDEVDTKRADDDFSEAYDDTAVEPTTWSRLAYMGYMWWASAGERDAYTTAERETDRELIGDLSAYSQSLETAIIAYFHRQSSLLIRSLSQIIEEDTQGEREEDDNDSDAVVVDRDDLSRMGLDTWSEADRAFVQEFGSLYFGRTIGVKGSEVECCGLRVPIF